MPKIHRWIGLVALSLVYVVAVFAIHPHSGKAQPKVQPVVGQDQGSGPSWTLSQTLNQLSPQLSSLYSPLNLDSALAEFGWTPLRAQSRSLTPKMCVLRVDEWTLELLAVPIASQGVCKIRLWAVFGAQPVTRRAKVSNGILEIQLYRGPLHENA